LQESSTGAISVAVAKSKSQSDKRVVSIVELLIWGGSQIHHAGGMSG